MLGLSLRIRNFSVQILYRFWSLVNFGPKEIAHNFLTRDLAISKRGPFVHIAVFANFYFN